MKDLRGTPLVFRVDADSEIGTGHLMRCLALAQAWKDNAGTAAFVTGCRNEKLLKRLDDEGFQVYKLEKPFPDISDWTTTKKILSEYPGSWVVLDGYHFNETYQKRIKETGHPLLSIDDMAHLKHYYADILLNQNYNSEKLPYSCEPYTRLLTGTKYILLRREFLEWKTRRRKIPDIARHVLVTMGGSDPANVSLVIIQALQRLDIPGLEAVVIIGAANPKEGLIQKNVKQSKLPVVLVHDAENMPELMARADVAISAGGTTVWELAFMGLPSALVTLADNQKNVTAELSNAGVSLDLGRYSEISATTIENKLLTLLLTKKMRVDMSTRGRQIVDGEGVRRVISAMLSGTEGAKITLRHALKQDCRFLWILVNDPAVRKASFNSSPISWEEHQRWFEEKISDPRCIIYIVLGKNDTPIGQVRFDIDHEGNAESAISINAEERNKRYGSTSLILACRRVMQEYDVKKIFAHIKEDNKSSVAIFTKAGFLNKGLKNFKGHNAFEMVYQKE